MDSISSLGASSAMRAAKPLAVAHAAVTLGGTLTLTRPCRTDAALLLDLAPKNWRNMEPNHFAATNA
jgi:hypothetical protein